MIQPTGPQGEAIRLLAEMIAATPAFSNRVSATSQDAALSRIHFPYVLEPEQEKKPFVVIEQGGVNWSKLADGTMIPDGRLRLKIADTFEAIDDERDSLVQFTNFADGILEELAYYTGTDDLLNIVQITQTQEPVATNPVNIAVAGTAQRPFFWAGYDVIWNTVGGGQ
jgi:hypothetical protein